MGPLYVKILSGNQNFLKSLDRLLVIFLRILAKEDTNLSLNALKEHLNPPQSLPYGDGSVHVEFYNHHYLP